MQYSVNSMLTVIVTIVTITWRSIGSVNSYWGGLYVEQTVIVTIMTITGRSICSVLLTVIVTITGRSICSASSYCDNRYYNVAIMVRSIDSVNSYCDNNGEASLYVDICKQLL